MKILSKETERKAGPDTSISNTEACITDNARRRINAAYRSHKCISLCFVEMRKAGYCLLVNPVNCCCFGKIKKKKIRLNLVFSLEDFCEFQKEKKNKANVYRLGNK